MLRTSSLATIVPVPGSPPAWTFSQSAASCAFSPAKDASFALMASSTAFLASSLAHSMLLTVWVPPVVATFALKIWMPL